MGDVLRGDHSQDPVSDSPEWQVDPADSQRSGNTVRQMILNLQAKDEARSS